MIGHSRSRADPDFAFRLHLQRFFALLGRRLGRYLDADGVLDAFVEVIAVQRFLEHVDLGDVEGVE